VPLLGPNSATADHVVPVSEGGSNALANFVLSCRYHNTLRGSMDYRQYRQELGLVPCPGVWERADALPRKKLMRGVGSARPRDPGKAPAPQPVDLLDHSKRSPVSLSAVLTGNPQRCWCGGEYGHCTHRRYG
jgi:hypothetical protein